MHTESPRAGIGFALAAIAMWSTLAAVTALALQRVAVFTLLAIALGIGGGTLLAADRMRGRPWRDSLCAPPRALALGLWGIFGYHAFLYGALAVAGEAQVAVNLVNYLWPLSLVAFAGVLEGGFRGRAVAGTMIGLTGAVVAITTRGLRGLTGGALFGAALALGAAVTWGGFSALLPRVSGAQGRMAGWCLYSAVVAGAVALILHLSGAAGPTESPWPDLHGWLAAIWLGVGPLGLAFAAWEAALRRTSGQVVGAIAYLAPPISTILLALAIGAALPWQIWIALALVVSGAALGASSRTPATAVDGRG